MYASKIQVPLIMKRMQHVWYLTFFLSIHLYITFGYYEGFFRSSVWFEITGSYSLQDIDSFQTL